MKAAQCVRGVLRVLPVSVAKHARIGPGRHDLAEEQIVAILIVRLGNHAALQPRDAAVDQRCGNLRAGKSAHAGSLGELVGVPTGDRADGERLAGDGASGHVQRKLARTFDEFARERIAVDDDGDLGRRKIQRHRPGGGHDIAACRVSAAHENGRAVVEQTIGLGEFDGQAIGHMSHGGRRVDQAAHDSATGEMPTLLMTRRGIRM